MAGTCRGINTERRKERKKVEEVEEECLHSSWQHEKESFLERDSRRRDGRRLEGSEFNCAAGRDIYVRRQRYFRV